MVVPLLLRVWSAAGAHRLFTCAVNSCGSESEEALRVEVPCLSHSSLCV